MDPLDRYDIDLGHDHFLQFTSWSPDRDLNPQYAGIPDEPKWGALIQHRKPSGEICLAGLAFDGEVQRATGHPESHRWKVESMEPLTLSPSILCKAEGCNDHGFIRDSKWVPA